ncbi:MAG TPA: hypothetical protein VFL97_10995, partial [Nitrococcus sp.]|nr:hypothetical protein [Nitrococcus sp.]
TIPIPPWPMTDWSSYLPTLSGTIVTSSYCPAAALQPRIHGMQPAKPPLWLVAVRENTIRHGMADSVGRTMADGLRRRLHPTA